MPICAADKEGGPRQVYVAKGTGTNHTVTEWMTGYLSCTCPDWRNRRNLYVEHDKDAPYNNHCKHIHTVLEGRWIDTPRAPVGANPMFRQPVPIQSSRSSQLNGRVITLGDEEV